MNKQKIKKIVNITANVLFYAFIALVALLTVSGFFGIEPHIVLSGSMEPEIMTGSLVYVKSVSAEEAQNLQVGDTVTFVANKSGTKVTHKIYEVVGPLYVKDQNGKLVLDENGQPIVATDDFGEPIIMYTTYGINNKNESQPTGYDLDGTPGVGNLGSSNVVGKPIFSIPLLGYVASFVQNPPGQYIAIAVCALLLFNVFLGGSGAKAADSSTEANDGEPLAQSTDTERSAEPYENSAEEIATEPPTATIADEPPQTSEAEAATVPLPTEDEGAPKQE